MGKIILFASGKGGVGKTTLAVNTGVSLALNGKKVIIADMNIGLRNDDIYLGLENNILFDFGDVCSGLCKLEKAIVKYDRTSNLSLLSCPQYKDIEGLTPGHIRALYAKLRREFDYVLVDLPVLSGEQLAFYSMGADESVVVVNHDYVSVRNGDAVNRKLSSLGISKRYYVVNRIHEDYYGSDALPDTGFISKSIDAECLGFVKTDMSVHIDNNNGSPTVLEFGSELHRTFTEIAGRLL